MSDKKKCPFCEAIALQRFIEEHHSKPAGFGMALSAALVSYAVVNGRKCGRTTDYMKDGKWNDGSVIHIRHLREHNYYNGVDYGQDYTGLADYLFNHWTPEQGGHRWKATRNLRQPEKETPTLALRTYTEKKAPIAPKGYKLVEARATKWGYIYYKYVREPEKPKRRKKRE